jgi:hypothetical protein
MDQEVLTMKDQTKRIAQAVDTVHALLDDGQTGHQVIEHLLSKLELDMFEASHALAQARRELRTCDGEGR